MSLSEKDITQEMMARIGNADSPAEAFALYRLAAPYLKDCKFILAAKSGAEPGFAVNRTFSAGASIRSTIPPEWITL